MISLNQFIALVLLFGGLAFLAAAAGAYCQARWGVLC